VLEAVIVSKVLESPGVVGSVPVVSEESGSDDVSVADDETVPARVVDPV
jgi:hypothetical protein